VTGNDSGQLVDGSEVDRSRGTIRSVCRRLGDDRVEVFKLDPLQRFHPLFDSELEPPELETGMSLGRVAIARSAVLVGHTARSAVPLGQ
jgi:hypothetical protein